MDFISSHNCLYLRNYSEIIDQLPMTAGPPPPLAPPPTILVQEVSKRLIVNGNSQLIFKLTQAIEEDSLRKMSALIEGEGVDVNTALSYRVCILLKAIRSRATQCVEYLISKNADPQTSVLDMMKRPCGLEVAYSNCQRYDKWSVDILKKLLPRLGERLHKIVDEDGRTLLHLACYFPDLSIFEYLLRFGLDPNVKDKNEANVLSLLISHMDVRASLEMVQLVLSLPNSQVDIRNHTGSTPLYQSFLTNRLELFYLLLRKGADPFIRTYSGNTLMHCSFLHCPKYMMLYDLGLDVNACNSLGLRPLQNKTELNFEFLLLVVLGRDVLEEEYVKLEKSFGPKVVQRIKERVEKGEFAKTRLQSLCRQTIRKLIFRKDHHSNSGNIWSLPLPKPLCLYLDVIMYTQHLLETFSH